MEWFPKRSELAEFRFVACRIPRRKEPRLLGPGIAPYPPGETAELRFPTYHPEESGYDTLRDLLREAIANNETIARNHGELLQAAAQEAAA